MKKATEIALRKSIKKWEAIVANKGIDMGDENCALCHRFKDTESWMDGPESWMSPFCTRGEEKCPVYEASGSAGCNGTPYTAWVASAAEDGDLGHKIADNESAIAAVLELEFLKSLLPRKK